MLDKKDLKDIKRLIQDSLTEFFETLILPYFERNEDDHKEIKQILDKHGAMLNEHGIALKSHGELLEKHDVSLDKIYRKLEKNEDDHEEMLERLGKVERSPRKLPGKN